MKTIQGGVTTYYISDLIEYSGGTFTKYYYADGQRIAQRVGSGAPTYTLGDHLGSTRYTLNSSGTKTSEMRYYPWGSTHYSSNPTATPRRQYTGQINDGDTGLYYYNARYYEPGLARFVQADTIVPDPKNPQTFNRYTYTNNNPVRYTDPTGHCIDGLTTAACIVGGILITAMIVDYGWTLYDMWQYQAIIDDPNSTPEEKEEARVMLLITGGAEMIEPDVGVQLPLDDLARHGIIAVGQEAAEEGAERVAKEGAESLWRSILTAGRSADEIAEIDRLASKWDKSTFSDAFESINYHYNRHGTDFDLIKYLRKAEQFNIYARGVTREVLDDGITIRYRKGNEFIYMRNGLIVTYGFNP